MFSCFAAIEPCCQGPATSCKIIPGPGMAETSMHFDAERGTLFDALSLCHGSVLITTPNVCLLHDLRSIMWSWHTTWLTWSHASTSSYMRGLILLHHEEITCLSAFFLIVSEGSAGWLITVANAIRDSLETETIVGIRAQHLERLEGSNSHGWRSCYHGLKCSSS